MQQRHDIHLCTRSNFPEDHFLLYSVLLFCIYYTSLSACIPPPSLLPSRALLTDSLPSGWLSDKQCQMEPCHCCCWPQLSSLRLLLSSAVTALFISTNTGLVGLMNFSSVISCAGTRAVDPLVINLAMFSYCNLQVCRGAVRRLGMKRKFFKKLTAFLNSVPFDKTSHFQ